MPTPTKRKIFENATLPVLTYSRAQTRLTTETQNLKLVYTQIPMKRSLLRIKFSNSIRNTKVIKLSGVKDCRYVINPPEAIPLSDRPGHFFSIRFLTWSTSGHTTVSQTGFLNFFLKVVFDQDVSGHTMVCQTVFLKDILDWDVNVPRSHRPGLWYGH